MLALSYADTVAAALSPQGIAIIAVLRDGPCPTALLSEKIGIDPLELQLAMTRLSSLCSLHKDTARIDRSQLAEIASRLTPVPVKPSTKLAG